MPQEHPSVWGNQSNCFLGKNTTLLGQAMEVAATVSQDILVVLGANAQRIKKEVSESVKSVFNSEWESGMGTSIALGVQELERELNPEHILVLLVDQPLIDSTYLKEIMLNGQECPKNIIATSYQGRAGVPALFPKKYYKELKLLNKDYGAKNMMANYTHEIILIDSKGKAVDLDTRLSYNTFWKNHGR